MAVRHPCQIQPEVRKVHALRPRKEFARGILPRQPEHGVARFDLIGEEEPVVLEVINRLDGDVLRLDIQRVVVCLRCAAVDGRMPKVCTVLPVCRTEVDRVPRLNGLVRPMGIAAVDGSIHDGLVLTQTSDAPACDGDDVPTGRFFQFIPARGEVGTCDAAVHIAVDDPVRDGDLILRNDSSIVRR